MQSTLEQVVRADLLLHVVDASSPQAPQQHDVVVQVRPLPLPPGPRAAPTVHLVLFPDSGAVRRALQQGLRLQLPHACLHPENTANFAIQCSDARGMC